jgi:endoglucanase
MVFDRRSLLATLGASVLTAGCVKPVDSVKPDWAAFKAAFFRADGRIVDTGNGGVSHTEGQGYGMLMAAAADDPAAFDAMWRWTDATLSQKTARLFSWRYDPAAANPISDPNNATDGDLLLAWALLRGGTKWQNKAYLGASEDIRAAILRLLIKPLFGRIILLPAQSGFEQSDFVTLNPSYYVWPALDEFQQADGNGIWDDAISDGLKLVRDARFGAANLLTDWIDIDASGAVTPARGRPPRFGYDAIRVPLYLAWSKRYDDVARFADFWRPYQKSGHPIPAWVDVTNGAVADYAISDGGLAVVDLATRTTAPARPSRFSDYYSGALVSLADIAQSG